MVCLAQFKNDWYKLLWFKGTTAILVESFEIILAMCQEQWINKFIHQALRKKRDELFCLRDTNLQRRQELFEFFLAEVNICHAQILVSLSEMEIAHNYHEFCHVDKLTLRNKTIL